ncbi:LacI family DNA-binding transcriptional regulator [Jeotgalibacillus proteolyticus]|uniref:LacI family transcriptional regulator n=1 Tax=Jeotgalibacillus proteolyticus TaxID=2082395 RepID=A0A2S5GBK7_9BACL|nr:LacI family DNA-binding transcriptional regulator [Jeotgalibacillus proteolyticus]PPA70412.1 LacI family transcriptional regulator [Jeotgalibacillus proteolyticus]
MKITIADVAIKAGVSKTTVSRILNGNFDHTTEETKQRILKAIEELDYRPNALAKSLKSMKTNVLGIVLSNFKNPFWINVLEGVEDTCREMGYNLMISNSNEESSLEKQYIQEFQMRQVDGMIINPTAQNHHVYQKLVDAKFPIVFINRRVEPVVAQNVVVDNIKGSYAAVKQLLKNNRRKVSVILFRNEHVSTWKERVEGYKKALLDHGYTEKDFLILALEPAEKNKKERIIEYLQQNPEIDSIFSTNNMLTLEIMEAIRKLDKSIPEDISLVGYDETVWAKHINPPLTTIWQPGYEMGRVAAVNLINSIEGKPPTFNTVVLEPKLIVRESCGEK